MTTERLRMNDDPELFNKTNNVSRKDAISSLNSFASKFKWKKNNLKVIDIGSADGSVTCIMSQYLPANYEMIIGGDVNTNSVEFANNRYGTDRIKFIKLDIAATLPENLREDFDYVFSFYTMHWLAEPEKGYRNVYNLLRSGGECFITVMAKTPFFDIFRALSTTQKWAPWIKDLETIVSPYHDSEDPDDQLYDILKSIGFSHVHTKCKQKVHVYENTQIFKDTISSINPFKMPADLLNELMEDYVEVSRDMRLVGDDGSVTFSYNIVQIYCIK